MWVLLLQELDLNFFIRSVLGPSEYGGYQLLNSPILWGLFLLFYFFLYLFLKKTKIKIDFRLLLAILPYLILGTIIRCFTDSGLLPYSISPLAPGFYTHSPGLWMAIFFLIVAALSFSKELFWGKSGPIRIFGATGFLLMLIALAFYLSLSPDLFFIFYSVAIILIAGAAIIGLASKFIKSFRGDYFNYLAVAGQVIDGIGTVLITISKNCSEQHFVSDFILGQNFLLFPLLKISLIIAGLHIIDRLMKEGDEKNFVKIVLIGLGFMTGPRNILTAAIGNCN